MVVELQLKALYTGVNERQTKRKKQGKERRKTTQANASLEMAFQFLQRIVLLPINEDTAPVVG